MRILVVEDDPLTAQGLAALLSQQNYVVEVAANGDEGRTLAEGTPFDLILLDVVLPRINGIELCRILRSDGVQAPILLLTGKDSSHDKAIGLDAGADDYVVKPFDPDELSARIRALLRRGQITAMPILEWGKLQLDPSTCQVSYGDVPIALTPKEFALLELFLRNSSRVFSCGIILEQLWPYEEAPGEEAVRTHIKGLRQKLKAAGAPGDLIETVYGIGYRLKQEKVKKQAVVSPAQPQPVKAATTQQTAAAISAVWERYKGRVSEQVHVLERVAMALLQDVRSPDLLRQAEQEAHTLAGSLGTFGYAQGSTLARSIEHVLQQGALRAEDVSMLSTLVADLRKELGFGSERAEPPAAFAPPTVEDSPLLLIIDRDRDMVMQLKTLAPGWGLRVQTADSLEAARKAIAQTRPEVVLLDLEVGHAVDESLELLSDLTRQADPIPVVVFTAQDELRDRLEVARLGGSTYLHKPVPFDQVMDTVSQVMLQRESGGRLNAAEARVMVVDDDPNITSVLRTILEPWGLRVITLNDSRQFWDVLETALPDLLILDVKMPHISGIELCQVVRNDPRWSSLPVLFLTAHTDPAIVHQVFVVGGDDFVTKPIVGPELVTRIFNRLDRLRYLRRLTEIDPLTKVLNRSKSTEDMQQFLRLAKQHNQPLCLAVLDLDNLKHINLQWGHALGDLMLSRVGQLLRQTFRREEDVVARWGGEEFVIAMYGMDKRSGARRLSDVLERIRQESFFAPDGQTVHLTVSAGVVHYPQDGSDLHSLYRAADDRATQAKHLGGDRMLLTLSSMVGADRAG